MSTTYLTPAQVAAQLGLSVVTVQRHCRAGSFPGAVRVGRSWGIPPAALAGFRPRGVGNPQFGPGFWTARRRKSISRTQKGGRKKIGKILPRLLTASEQ